MSTNFSRAMAVLLMALTLSPLALLFLSVPTTGAVHFALCHEESPDSQSPAAPNHACCLVGHNHAIMARAAVVPPLQLTMVVEIPLPSLGLPMQARPEPALTSSDPPPGDPLRI